MVRRRPGGGRRSSRSSNASKTVRRSGPSRASGQRTRSSRAGRWLLLALAAVALFAAGLWVGSSGTGFDPGSWWTGLRDGGAASGSSAPAEASRSAGERSSRSGEAEPAPGGAPSDAPAPDGREAVHPETEFSAETVPEAMDVPERPPPGGGAVVSVVIDDLGRSLDDLDRIRGLGVPVTYAVLPFESRTPDVVATLGRRGEEMLLHLPMEPMNGANPGPGALTRAMSGSELASGTRRALDAVPGAVGVNHHMGSKLSTDRRAMETILGEIDRRGLFYLDSRTSPDSVAYTAARELDLPAAERQVFLDPDPRPEAVRYQFRRLLAEARSRGSAIAIGHPHPETLRVLEQEIPLARESGYRFVPVSYLLDRSSMAAK